MKFSISSLVSALQHRCQARYGSLGLIPEPIWKMSCNNLLELTLYRIKKRWRIQNGQSKKENPKKLTTRQNTNTS